jgi:prophage regulatory protein
MSQSSSVQHIQPRQLLRLPAVMERVGFRKSWIYREANNGFPAPIKVGGASVWDSKAIDLWIEAKAGQSKN